MASRIHREVYVRFWEGFGQTYGSNAARRLIPTLRGSAAAIHFWDKAERLLLTALIAYLHYEAPVEEQNFATLLEMLNTMQVSEDDEDLPESGRPAV